MRERPTGDFDYERAGAGHASMRRRDDRIAAQVDAALGGVETVPNVGAGSCEAEGPRVTAVEPTAAMRAQPELEGALRLLLARPRSTR